MRSLNIYTRKYFTFVCAGLGSRRGEVMTASICILIITRKNDRSGNLAKKLSRRECCKLVAVKSFEPILPWLVHRLSGVTTYLLTLTSTLPKTIYWYQPSNINISTHFSCLLNTFSSINCEDFSTKGPPLSVPPGRWPGRALVLLWCGLRTMIQDLCLNGRRHTLGPRLLSLVK